MINFEFNAEAYKASIQRELIPAGQYRAKITGVSVRTSSDGSVVLSLDLTTTYNNGASFRENVFLNPPSHPYFSSSNRRFGDLCVSCRVSPFDVKNDENTLIGCICGIELVHKKSKDGSSEFNSVKKFLSPNDTERLKEFSNTSTNTNANTNTQGNNAKEDMSPLDPENPESWF